MAPWLRSLLGSAAMLGVACSPEATPGPGPDPDPADEGCGVAAIEVGGACLPVGVAPEACAEGFVSDERGGCEPLLPEESCGPGQMAIPGETTCRPVAPCGEEPWAGIPLEGGPVTFVDASFVGQSDGSMQAPYTTLPEAIAYSAGSMLVAIAPGTYPLSQTLNHPLRFWGRCPRDVHVVWGGTIGAILNVTPNASGAEFHRISMASDGEVSISVAGEDVIFDEVWFHDANLGPAAVDVVIPASFTVRRSLIENVRGLGLFAGGSHVRLEQSVIRDMAPAANGMGGGAVLAALGVSSYNPSSIVVERSVIAGAWGAGITGDGSSVVVRGSVVRDVVPESSTGQDGMGVAVATGLADPGTPSLVLEGSLVERARTAGVLGIGAPVEVRDTVIRDVASVPVGGQVNGEALVVQLDAAGVLGSLEASGLLIERSEIGGMLVADAAAQIDGLIVREIFPGAEGVFGDGVMIVSFASPAAMSLTQARIESTTRAGMAAFGAGLEVSQTRFACNPIEIAAELQDPFEPQVTDAGDNECVCGEESWPCKARSANLTPPLAL